MNIKRPQRQDSSGKQKSHNKPLILLLSHCLLNQKVRAQGLTSHPEIKEKLLQLVEKYSIEIEQLPCPEFLLLGERETKTYDEYSEIPHFKSFCNRLAEDVAEKLHKFHNCTLLLAGIARSPTCSLSLVYDREKKLKRGRGIFMEFLQKKLNATSIEIDYDEIENSVKKIEDLIRTIS